MECKSTIHCCHNQIESRLEVSLVSDRCWFLKGLVMQIACRATPWDVQFPHGRNAPHEAVPEPVPLDHALRKTTPILIQMLHQRTTKTTPIWCRKTTPMLVQIQHQTPCNTTPISVSPGDTDFGVVLAGCRLTGPIARRLVDPKTYMKPRPTN